MINCIRKLLLNPKLELGERDRDGWLDGESGYDAGIVMPLVYFLRGCVTVSEIVFVEQCEVFVCLDFVHFFFFPWPRSS